MHDYNKKRLKSGYKDTLAKPFFDNLSAHLSNLLKNKRIILLGLFFLLYIQNASATHLEAGEIVAVRDKTNPLKYCFTIRLYTFSKSSARSDQLTINMGDGKAPVVVARTTAQPVPIGLDIDINIYEFCYTYSSQGNYWVSFQEENRNDGVLNMASSVNTPFNVETLIVINPADGFNATPVLTVPPLDVACVGQKFTHNPGAYDADGDSLAFKLTVPQKARNVDVDAYRLPHKVGNGQTEDKSGPATFQLDPLTGTMTWDAPAQAGSYNVAFLVEEWRNGKRIGYVVRDMQILVIECTNKRPDLKPDSLCLVAHVDIETRTVKATDFDLPDRVDPIVITVPFTKDANNNEVKQSLFNSDLFGADVATFTFNPSPQNAPANGTFHFEPKCKHVREQPYFIVFKVEDRPPAPNNPLSELETWKIVVKGPPVKNLVATPGPGSSFDLTWDDYKLECPGFTQAQFDKMQYVIWRKDGCRPVLACTEDPIKAGYQEIGRQALSDNTFSDIGPLSKGLTYSYIITVDYPKQPFGGGGVSQASVEACVSLPVDVPVITKVSVTETSATTGKILLKWTSPPQLNTPPPPYYYELYRAEGLNGTNFVKIHEQADDNNPNPFPSYENQFLDNNLNTLDKAYSYKIVLLTTPSPNPTRVDTSSVASSVRLTATPGENQIILDWAYNVPWSNFTNEALGVYKHLIYRKDGNGTENLIDSVRVGTPRYVDKGKYMGICLDPDVNYSYRVETKGSYFNPNIPVSPLNNFSQEDTASPDDNLPPPPPMLEIDSVDCSALAFKLCSETLDQLFISFPDKNKLTWQPDPTSICNEVSEYRLYYKAPGQEDYDRNSPVYTGTNLTFMHDPEFMGITSLAGCYVVTAVDKSGNESDFSNEVCQDNCLYYKLPNIMTANGDGLNDIFIPCPEPLYVLSAKVEIFNRWGVKVFETEDININWDGTNTSGQKLDDGVYYYSAKVKFITIDKSRENQEFKGWIRLVR